MLNFVCANDINSREIIDKLAEMMNGKQSLYLTATQSIKKLRKESAILSSFLHENIYSITEFIQAANKEVYATEDVLSVADSRYILSKVIGYKFANDQDKYRLYYEMRYDIFELFRTLIFHEKSVSEKGIAEIGHDFSCFEEDLFDLYAHYRVDKMESIEITEEDRVLSEEPFDLSAYSKTTFAMFGGEETEVSIKFENDLVGVVFDRFGTDVRIVKADEDHFICTVKVAVSPHFLSWIVSFGRRAKIMAPDYVVDEMYALIRESLENYED